MDLFNSFLANYGDIESNVDKDPLIVTAPISALVAGHFRFFLNWFIIRKVIADGGKKQYVPVLQDFVEWLNDQKVLAEPAYREIKEALAELKGEPERCEKLASILADFAEKDSPTYQDWLKDKKVYQIKTLVKKVIHPQAPQKVLEGLFSISKIGKGVLWLTPDDAASDLDDDPDADMDTQLGPIPVPIEACKLAKVGDQIDGSVGKMKGYWKLLEAWNVYP